MPTAGQPPRRRGTIDRPYSALNLRFFLALFGLLTSVALAGLAFGTGFAALGWVLVLVAVTATVDLVVIGRRRRLRDRDGDASRSLFE